MSELLKFNLNAMKVYLFIPTKNTEQSIRNHIFKDMLLWFTVLSVLYGSITDFYNQAYLGLYEDILSLVDGIVTVALTLYVGYVMALLRIKRRDLLNLQNLLEKLCDVSRPPELMKTEMQARLFSKAFIIYTTCGCLCYAFFPLLFIHSCKKQQVQSKLDYQVPCGLPLRLSYPFDVNSTWGFLFASYAATGGTFIFGNIQVGTHVLQGAVVWHIIGHIKHLKNNIRKAFLLENPRVEFNKCLFHHSEIIKFLKEVDTIFTDASFIHSFFSTVLLSVLAFQMKLLQNFYDICRFTTHFFGWVFVLYLRNHVGQLLINESLDIGNAFMYANWPGSDLTVQRDMVLALKRVQNPLVLSRGNYGILSLEAFYSTMATAYSYFTLLTSTTD